MRSVIRYFWHVTLVFIGAAAIMNLATAVFVFGAAAFVKVGLSIVFHRQLFAKGSKLWGTACYVLCGLFCTSAIYAMLAYREEALTHIFKYAPYGLVIILFSSLMDYRVSEDGRRDRDLFREYFLWWQVRLWYENVGRQHKGLET